MIFRFLIYVFLFYLAYKFLFEFVLPVYRTTRQVRRGFRNMQEKMQQSAGGFGQQARPEKEKQTHKGRTGEYIDFEEVKD